VIDRIEIRNFAVARQVAVAPGPGLNVFTGETGAGKSLVVDALAFAFGARRGREVVAGGADRAEVRVFLAGGTVVERSVGLAGRSSARIGGGAASLEDLLTLGRESVDIHGQSEHLSILRPSVQLAALDRFAGCEDRVACFAGPVRELREVRRRLSTLLSDSRERERRIEQLGFETAEIMGASLRPGEEEELRAEQSRLANTTRLLEDTAVALAALEGAEIGSALRAIADLAGRDPDAGDLHDLATLLDVTAADLVRGLRRYREAIEEDPERLHAVGERLDLLARLRRKYGETVEAVLAYAASAEAEMEALTGAAVSAEELEASATRLARELGSAAEDLSLRRRAAAARLVAAVGAELTQLGMEGASLAAGFACEDAVGGIAVSLPDYELITPGMPASTPVGEPFARSFSESGVDRVELQASFNAGEAPRPLGSVASGGETSRFLLALATVLGSATSPRTIVLDEVDEGVGGRSGRLVGRALRRLAESHQVLCITHLPQVAAFAEHHFVVSKQTDGARTWSDVREVHGDQRLDELAAMLGGRTEANRAAARELVADSDPTSREFVE
jgi:DNA repair protein RecN (Recombination protein N)